MNHDGTSGCTHPDFEQENAQLHKRLEECDAAARQNSTLIDDLRCQLAANETQRRAALAEMSTKTADRDRLETIRVRLNEQIAALRSELDVAKARTKAHETALEAEGMKLNGLGQEHAQALASMSEERDVARRALDVLQTEGRSARDEIERVLVDDERMRLELAQWKDSFAVAQSECERSRKQKRRATRLVLRLAAALSKSRVEKAGTEATHEAAIIEIAQLSVQVTTLEQDRQRAQQESLHAQQSWQSRIDELAGQLLRQHSQAVADKAEYDDELRKVLQDQRRLRDATASSDKAHKELEGELARARAELELQEDQTYDATMREQNNELSSKKKLNALNEEIDELRKVITQTNSQLVRPTASPEKEYKGKSIRLHYLRYNGDGYDAYVRYFPESYAEEITRGLGLRSAVFCEQWTLAFPPSYMIIPESTASQSEFFGELWREKGDLYMWRKEMNDSIGHLTDSLKPTLKRPREADRSAQAGFSRRKLIERGEIPLPTTSALQLAGPPKRRVLGEKYVSPEASHELRVIDVSDDHPVDL